jgi:hypothetical protein
MKKFNLFTAISAVLLLSFFVTSGLHASEPGTAGDKWAIKSVKVPTTCKLGGVEVGDFRIKIKNTGDVISTGERITIKINITYNGQNLGGLEVGDIASGIAPGKTKTFSVLCTNNNFKQFTSTAGNKSISASVELVCAAGTTSITKSFTIKVK